MMMPVGPLGPSRSLDVASLEHRLRRSLATAFAGAAPDVAAEAPIDPLLRAGKHADFQADAALALAKRLGRAPRDVAADVVARLADDPLIEALEVAGPGFIDIRVSSAAISEGLAAMLDDERLGVPAVEPRTVVVDYSAPNVAKEMHVGHLRSTIIGDACVRLLEWQGHAVLRRNHIGDWGTPFGMLIEHLLDLGETEAGEELSQGDLDGFYRGARETFDASEAFRERARARVVALQSGDPETRRLWSLLIEQSQRYFVGVYERMDVRLDGGEFRGESAYNDRLGPVLDELRDAGLIELSDGAECLFPPDFRNRDGDPLPLIVRKRGGGYGYAATDLAALRERTVEDRADRLLYVVGAPQGQHLDMVFAAARMAGWLAPPAMAEHVAFGSVLGADGKMFRSRGGGTVRLAELLAEAVARATATIEAKNPGLDDRTRRDVADAVGIGAVKYADLSSDRTRDYAFDFDRMLSLEGNTAPYLQYAHARIRSILRKAGTTAGPDDERIADVGPRVDAPAERALGLRLLRFPDVVADVTRTLLFHRLAAWLYDLATAYSAFYAACPVLGAPDEATRRDRLALCRCTASALSTGLAMLGIRAPERM